MLIISLINFIINILFFQQNITSKSLPLFIFYVVFGFHKGVGICWFIYTLILLKVLYQYFSPKKLFYELGVLSLFLAYILNNNDFNLPSFIYEPNSIISVFIAYPFYAFGIYLRKYKTSLNSINGKKYMWGIFVISFIFFLISSHYNDYVWMYKCYYGRNLFLFLLSGIFGTCCVFVLAKLLGRTSKIILIISKGTIIILGFHMYFIKIYRAFFQNSYVDFIVAAIIIIFFIPMIILFNNYFPLIIGKYRHLS